MADEEIPTEPAPGPAAPSPNDIRIGREPDGPWRARIGSGPDEREGWGDSAVEALSSLFFQLFYGGYPFDMTIGPH